MMTASASRRNWILAIALLSVILLTLVLAPANTRLLQGSTYSRAPDGYGAWYASLEQQRVPVRRWQRPLEELLPPESATDSNDSAPENPSEDRPLEPITLVRVLPAPRPPSDIGMTEVRLAEAGSVVVILGIQTPVSAAPFVSRLDSPDGAVVLETRRRFRLNLPAPEPPAEPGDVEMIRQVQIVDPDRRALLQDEYGTVAWVRRIGSGAIISVNTPHLAANAYQGSPGNFAWLTRVVTEARYPIWIDEYVHGYRDRDVLQDEARETLWGYFGRTPVVLVLIQAAVLVGLAIWGDRRLGPPTLPQPKSPNSSLSYIQALGGVLEKAGSSEFVQDTLSQAEQAHLQRTLGLGTDPADPDVVLNVWQTQSKASRATLEPLLVALKQKKHLGERDLLIWLGKLQKIRQSLPGSSPPHP